MISLVVDANILVAELLRQRGRNLILSSELELYVTERVISETRYELNRRVSAMVNKGTITETESLLLLELTQNIIETEIEIVFADLYINLEAEARERIPRDPDDWPTVALAMALKRAIWTQDKDFLGCGCPTWTTETLVRHLRRYSNLT